MIPSEKELCDAFKISRSTVRQAIGELEDEELVIRRRGLGTFISEPKIKRNLNNVYSFTKDMKSLGFSPSSIVQGFKIIEANNSFLDAFDFKGQDKRIYKIIRLRCANGVPLLLETTFIPVYIIPDLNKKDLTEGSLYEIIKQRADIFPETAEETYETTLIDEETAGLLKCKVNSCGFYVERRTWDANGTLYELTQSIIRGDKTKFVVKMKKDEVSWDRSFEELSKN